MAEPPNITQILAALAAKRPEGTPGQGQPPPQYVPPNYQAPYQASTPSAGTGPYTLPQPSNSGSLDISNIKPTNSGSVSIADAIAQARSRAAEKGIAYDGGRGTPHRDGDPRLAGRSYRPRSRSRSPPRVGRDSFRDNYNPYRDERRDDPRRTNGPGFARDGSFSPRGRRGNFSPPPSRGFGSGDRSPPSYRGGDEGYEIITIDSGLVGLIIGRQGESLRRVEADTGTRVQFVTGPDAAGPKRSCKITGTRAQRDHAKDEIYRIIDENGAGPRGNPPPDRSSRGGSKAVSGHSPALRAGEDATQIMVPNRTVGLIIGRGGETIRDLQEKSQCHVNIVGEEKSVNGLRPVNLIGSVQAAQKAKDLIMEIVESDTKSLGQSGGGPRDAGRAPAGAGDKDMMTVPSEAVGMIIGKGGETIRDMQTTTGCKINVTPPSGQDFQRAIELVGSRASIEQAKNAIMEKVHAVEEKNHGGEPRRHDDPYSDPYSQAQQSYGQAGGAPTGQQSQMSPTGDGATDPYAAWGGYQNYLALWYASMQGQGQHSQGQGPPGEQRPPGTM